MRKIPLGWSAGLFFFLMIPVYAHAAGEIKVDIADYDFGTPQHTKLALAVKVQSEYEIRKVTAEVDDREVGLELAHCDTACTWTTDFPLDGLQQGEKAVTVTAFDYAGRTGTMTKNFLYDAPPEVQITGVSKHHAVQSGKFRALVSTKDELSIPVISVSLSTAGSVIKTLEAKGSLDHEFDLTAYKDQIVTCRVQVYDGNRYLRFSSEYQLYVDPSTVIPVDNVEGTILDFDDTRTLHKGTDNKVRIKNRTDGTETIIYDAPYKYLGKSLLTPAGAVMNIYTNEDYGELFLWYSGQLKATGIVTFSGYGSQHSTIQTTGKYAFYDWTGDLINTETGEIRHFGRVGYAALAADGSFVAANNEGITLFQPDGTRRQLIKTDLGNPFPVFDGKTVLLNTNNYNILKYADGSLTEISKSIDYKDTTWPHSDFEINQGWIAYTKPTPSGRRQIFLESPQGTVTQVTYFNGNPKIRALNEHGTLAITYNSELYMYHPGDKEPKKLTSDSYYHLAPSYHIGTWYQAVEGTLFRLNYGPSAPGDTTAPQWPVTDALSVTDVTYHSAILQWQLATDETGVDKYLVYQDNKLLDTLNGTVNSYEVKGLSPKSSYLLSLIAVDVAGNQSVKKDVTVTTAVYNPVPKPETLLYRFDGIILDLDQSRIVWKQTGDKVLWLYNRADKSQVKVYDATGPDYTISKAMLSAQGVVYTLELNGLPMTYYWKDGTVRHNWEGQTQYEVGGKPDGTVVYTFKGTTYLYSTHEGKLLYTFSGPGRLEYREHVFSGPGEKQYRYGIWYRLDGGSLYAIRI